MLLLPVFRFLLQSNDIFSEQNHQKYTIYEPLVFGTQDGGNLQEATKKKKKKKIGERESKKRQTLF